MDRGDSSLFTPALLRSRALDRRTYIMATWNIRPVDLCGAAMRRLAAIALAVYQ